MSSLPKPPSSSSQFAKLQEGANKFRFLSDVVYGWEGWKDKKPFRHEGEVCKIKTEQVDLNKNGKPAINYFWAMVAWNYTEKRIQVLELTQKTIMSPLYDLQESEDWGDIKGYDVEINKKKEGDRTIYTVIPKPPKPVSKEIADEYKNTEIKLGAIFDGKYPMEEGVDEDVIPKEDIPF